LEFTNNCFTEKYKTCGAPLMWNPINIADIFRKYVKTNLNRLEEIHLHIFHSIMINQDFIDDESDKWLDFYNDMKGYLFISLCQREFSNISLSICKKICSFNKILIELLDVTFDIFISSMKIVYKNDIYDECHDNMKNLLTFISELDQENCKNYVYRLIKTFAISNNELYLNSNLLDLMNKIYQEERGDIFTDA
jgi:hypothetical protein